MPDKINNSINEALDLALRDMFEVVQASDGHETLKPVKEEPSFAELEKKMPEPVKQEVPVVMLESPEVRRDTTDDVFQPKYMRGVTGVPEGHAMVWEINEQGQQCNFAEFPTINAALRAMPEMMIADNAKTVVMNYKSSDGMYLDCWVLEHVSHLKRHKPLWQAIKDWWHRKEPDHGKEPVCAHRRG